MIKAGTKIPAATQTTILSAIVKIQQYYAPIQAVWSQATPDQQQAYLARSPILVALLAFAQGFTNGNNNR